MLELWQIRSPLRKVQFPLSAAIIAASKAKFYEKKNKGKSENNAKRVFHQMANLINELLPLEESSDEDIDPVLTYYEENRPDSETESDSV